MPLDERRRTLKADYIRDRGYWVAFNDGLLEHAPDFLERYLAYAALPARTGPLTARIRELIYVAIDASTTHLFEAGLRVHIALALRAGCTPTELIEVLQIATVQGLDSLSTGMSVLIEELGEAGATPAPLTLDLPPEHLAARDAYVRRFGEWPAFCDALLKLSPDFFKAMVDLLAAPELTGALDDKTRALVACALAASPTHLNSEALRRHIRRAITLGATAEELIEVLQLTTHLGVHACVLAVPVLMEATAEPES